MAHKITFKNFKKDGVTLNKTNLLIELYFIHFCLSLFEKYKEPVHVFYFLKACSTLFEMDNEAIQNLILKVMRQDYHLDKIAWEVIYLASRAGVQYTKLTTMTHKSRMTVYRRSRRLHHGWNMTTPIMTESELDICKTFMSNLEFVGGLV